MQLSTDTILAAVSAAGGYNLFTAGARHIPEWPLSCAKIWNWFRDTVQEVANQKAANPTK